MKRVQSLLAAGPGRFDQHGTGMATADLADTSVMSGTQVPTGGPVGSGRK